MITNLKKLLQQLHLSSSKLVDEKLFIDFSLQAPESFVARIKKRKVDDPLLLQILPQKLELQNVVGFNLDPLVEKRYSPLPGMIHKYFGRVLLLVTADCALNCRFCFRRHCREKVNDWSKVFSYLKNDATINEVILSGGDPLMLEPKELQWIMDRLATISHVKRIRIHSRIPIVMPQKITPKLLRAKIPVVLVVHCNHPQEINSVVANKLKLLQQQNITLFNQSVLLRGINDDSQVLVALSEKLFEVGVIPYYLHILDKVKGAAHFYVSVNKAKKVYNEMQRKLPGYLMPKLVMEMQNRKKYVY